jgi:hypothetical protein
MAGVMRDDELRTLFFRSSSAAFLAFSSSVRGLGVAFAVTAVSRVSFGQACAVVEAPEQSLLGADACHVDALSLTQKGARWRHSKRDHNRMLLL